MNCGDMAVYIERLETSRESLAACDPSLITKLSKHFKERDPHDPLCNDDLQLLKIIFYQRWYGIDDFPGIKDSPMDYLVCQDGNNSLWINLAHQLHKEYASQLLIPDYYMLLIPSITEHEFIVHGTAISDFSFADCILAEGDTELIHLPDSESYACANGGLYLNCSPIEPRGFTAIEVQRISRKGSVAERYVQRIKETANYKPTYPLQYTTIEAVKALVRESFTPKGLKKGHHLTGIEYERAVNAYKKFSEFLSQLEKDNNSEFVHLMDHPIQMYRSKYTFRVIWEGAFYKGQCMTSASEYFLKLVLDYHPEARDFGVLILEYIDTQRFTRAEPLEYADLIPAECARRLLILFISVMTENFSCALFTSQTITWYGYVNEVTRSGKQIHDQILPLLQRDDFSKTVGDYQRIIEMISTAKDSPKWLRYPGTDAWMGDILSGGIFTRTDLYASLPELFDNLVIELIKVNQVPAQLKVLYEFSDTLLNGFFVGHNSHECLAILQIMRINLFKEEKYNDLRERLSPRNTMTSTELFSDHMLDRIKRYLYFRLADLLTTNLSELSPKGPRFFKTENEFFQKVETIQVRSVHDLCEQIQHIFKETKGITTLQRANVDQYFYNMRNVSDYSSRRLSDLQLVGGYTSLLPSIFS